jgi:hypothetical protein
MSAVLTPDADIELRNPTITLPIGRQLVSIHTLAAATESYDPEKKYLLAMLVHVKAHQQNVTMPSTFAVNTARQRGYNTMFKKPRTNNLYRRVFFFLDLLTQGSCFVIFERDRNDELLFWRDMQSRTQARVGDIMLITEPERVENELLGHLSVVKTSRAFLAVHRPRMMTSFMPSIPDQDTFVGFHVQETSVTLQNILSVDTSCNGTFCDRLQPKMKPCGCYQNNKREYGANHVFKLTVRFDSPVPGNDEIVAPCSSLRLTQLLFKATLPPTMSRNTHIEPKLDEIRDLFREVANYINQNGGWSISGWLRPATTQEVGTSEEVYSETYGFHICYIHPANLELLDTAEFQELQKDPIEFFNP